MPIQPLLPFADVPVSCPVQSRYHAIAPCLAGKIEPRQQAKLLNFSYSTVSRWLKQFREDGMTLSFLSKIFFKFLYYLSSGLRLSSEIFAVHRKIESYCPDLSLNHK